jgi:hypothetical protein
MRYNPVTLCRDLRISLCTCVMTQLLIVCVKLLPLMVLSIIVLVIYIRISAYGLSITWKSALATGIGSGSSA